MFLRVLSLASLLLFAGFATAGISSPLCTVAATSWTFNSLNQNPCTVAAYLLSTCNGGSFTIDALRSGEEYSGPTISQRSDLCFCNTVTYSLMSACDACQGAQWPIYSKFTSKCTKRVAPGHFPNAIPAGTRVPHWAFVDVTVLGSWDNFAATAAGPLPEAGPGTKIDV